MKKARTSKGKKATAAKVDVYAEVTAQIIAALEQGVVPWRQPWKDSVAAAFATDGRPRNAVSGKAYRGANMLTLPLVGAAMGYADPRWVSFKQAIDLGGKVRKGEKATRVVFWKFFVKEGEEGAKDSRIPMLRTFPVFNVEQCDDIPAVPAPAEGETAPTDERGEAVVQAMPLRPAIIRTGSAAFYEPAADRVTMPDVRSFRTVDGFYHTLFHELAHSTGHASRLDRRTGDDARAAFGSASYSREELVAELTASMVGRACGIDPDVDTSAAYIASWLKVLKADSKALVQAAAKAQKAADWILNQRYDAAEVSPAKPAKVAKAAPAPVPVVDSGVPQLAMVL